MLGTIPPSEQVFTRISHRGRAMNHRQTLQPKLLDKLLPLLGASHEEVESYFTDVPMRYTECFARLTDGRTARLRDKRQFVGSCGLNGSRTLLCHAGSLAIELPTNTAGNASFVNIDRKITLRDGSLASLLSNI